MSDLANLFTVIAGACAVAALAWGVWIWYRPFPSGKASIIAHADPITFPIESNTSPVLLAVVTVETDADRPIPLSDTVEIETVDLDQRRLAPGMLGGYVFRLQGVEFPDGRILRSGHRLRVRARVKADGMLFDPRERLQFTGPEQFAVIRMTLHKKTADTASIADVDIPVVFRQGRSAS